MRFPLILAGALFAAAVAALAVTAITNNHPVALSTATRPFVNSEPSHPPSAGPPSPSGPFAVYSPPPATPAPRTAPTTAPAAPAPVMTRPQAPPSHGDGDEEEGGDGGDEDGGD
jgi:hypothetical protein